MDARFLGSSEITSKQVKDGSSFTRINSQFSVPTMDHSSRPSGLSVRYSYPARSFCRAMVVIKLKSKKTTSGGGK